MRNRTAPLLALLALTLAGCPGPVVKVHAPPQYAGGVPDDLFYENLALRTQEMAPEGFIPSDPEEAYRLALQELESRGIKIVPKADGFEAWSKFNTTFPTTIYVSNTWDEKTNALKGATLWHELVHVREYDYHTPLQMALMYATSEGRWALEVQAYRESFRVRRIFGVPEEEIREAMRPRAEFLYEEYELGTMPREYAVEKAIEIWMLDSPGN